MKRSFRHTREKERGISLPLALVALAIGALLVAPLLARVSVSMRTTTSVETALHSQYSSSAGAEYALWLLKNDDDFRQTLLDSVGSAHTLTMPGEVNGETPIVQAVCVRTETGGYSGEYLEWALWADASNRSLNINGGNNEFNGGIHSNNTLQINGGNNDFYGPVESYRTAFVNGRNNFYAGNPTTTARESLPITWDIEDFRDPTHEDTWAALAFRDGVWHVHPSGWNINGSDTIQPGLHFVTGTVNFNGGSHTVEGVTIVATGSINMNGTQSFTAYVPGLVLFSAQVTSGSAINLNGGGRVTLGGAIYAPWGAINVNGGNNISSALLGAAINLNGGNSTIDLASIPIPGTCGVYDIRSTVGGRTTTVRVSECEGPELTILSWKVD